MKKITLIIGLILLIVACNNTNREKANVDSESYSDNDTLEILKQRKIEIDSFVSQNPQNLTVLVKLIDQTDLFKIEKENFPESYDIETTFNVVKDKNGKIIYTCEVPQSQSGDWFVVLSYYFDENGNTFAFEKQTNAFNSMCAEITYENKTEYFDNDFKSIGSEYILKDDKNKKLDESNCDLWEYEYKILPNSDSFLKTNKIKKKHNIFKQIDTDIYEPIKNAQAFLNFAKQNFVLRTSQLNNWEIIQPISSKKENEITEKSAAYHKSVSNSDYYMILNVLESINTTTTVEKTSVKLPNGDVFDKWIEEFEDMGFYFQNVKGENGFQFAGNNGLMIKVGISNINGLSKDWSYEISIIADLAKMNKK